MLDDDRLVYGLGMRLVLVLKGEVFFAATSFYSSEGRHGGKRVSWVVHNTTLVRFRVLYKWLRHLFWKSLVTAA